MDDVKLKRQIALVANEFARAYNAKHKLKIKTPINFEYGLELKSLKNAKNLIANACYSTNTIGINMTLLKDNVSLFLNTIIPHEVAHLAQRNKQLIDNIKHDGGMHGWLWKDMMATMSQKPAAKLPVDMAKSEKAYREHAKQKKKAAKLTIKLLKNI